MNKEIKARVLRVMREVLNNGNVNEIDCSTAFYQFVLSKSYEFLSIDEAHDSFILNHPQYDRVCKFK